MLEKDTITLTNEFFGEKTFEATKVLEDGGSAVLDTLTATENKSYDAEDYNVDGWDKVNVNVPVPEPTLIEKTFTENGDYLASSYDADGFSSVIVEVPAPTLISKNITENGTYDAVEDNADGYYSVNVAVPTPTLITKAITENGTYLASTDNADGYSQVTVNVPGEQVYFSEFNAIPYTKNFVIPDAVYAQTGDFNLVFRKCPYMESAQILATVYRNFSWYAFSHNANLKTLLLPYCKKTSGAIASLYANQDPTPRTVQLGSIGYEVTELNSSTFSSDGGTGSNWEAHIYVNASTVADIPSAVTNGSPWGGRLI